MKHRSPHDEMLWRRVLQPSMSAHDPGKLPAGGSSIAPEIVEMVDLARFAEVCSIAPYFTGILLDTDVGDASVPESYVADNVIMWGSGNGSGISEPGSFMKSYERYAGVECLLVAPMKITIDRLGGEPLTIRNYLIIDRDRGLVDRIDPHPGVKHDLDAAIGAWLASHNSLGGFRYRSPDETGTDYHDLVNTIVIPWDCADNVPLDMWGYWLLYLRLFFSDRQQQEVFAEARERIVAGCPAADLLLNFYPDITADACAHMFGAPDAPERYPAATDLWRYLPGLTDRVRRITRCRPKSSQLNQILGRAIRELVERNDGGDYALLYEKYMGATPIYLPNCQDGGDWVPEEQMDPATRGILGGGSLALGYVPGEPFIYEDPPGHIKGFDYELGNAITAIINAQYRRITGGRLLPTWVPSPPLPPDYGATSDNEKFCTLYNGLEEGNYHAALSGQMVMATSNLPPGCAPEWTCATSLIFTAITYTGVGGLDLTPLVSSSREEFVRHMIGVVEREDLRLSFFSVVNPGPSPGSAQSLVKAINDRKSADAPGCALWVNGSIPETEDVITGRKGFHFMVGDSTISGWQARYLAPETALYLNIAAVDNPSILYDETVGCWTILPVAAFTLK